MSSPPDTARALFVADDDDDVAATVSRLFERRGWKVHRARTGSEAVAIARTSAPFDAAVVDLVLPGVGGLEVVRELRERHPRCRIVAMTGMAEAPMVAAFLQAGADAFVGKPFDIAALTAAVEGPPGSA